MNYSALDAEGIDAERLAEMIGERADRPPPTSKLVPPYNAFVAAGEQRERRQLIAHLLSNGFDRLEQQRAMLERFPSMTSHSITRLANRVLADWREEDALVGEHKRRFAERRHHRHIVKAAARNQYTAVANLEKNLMLIQGTSAPIAVDVEHRHVLSDALVAFLGQYGVDELRSLADAERALLTTGVAVPDLATPDLVNEQPRDQPPEGEPADSWDAAPADDLPEGEPVD